MAADIERRAFTECRVMAVDNRRLSGYAIKFNSLSVDLGGFREIIDPSAVDRTLTDAADIRALVDHETSKVLGRTRAGTLTLRKDSTGLGFTIEPDPDISYARDIMLAVKRGDVSGMSFAFRAIADEWNYDEKVPVRTVTDMRMSEISVVTFPAYPDTEVAMRSLSAFKASQKNVSIDWLRRVHKTRLAR
jgi:HK97 family phage prohead protease